MLAEVGMPCEIIAVYDGFYIGSTLGILHKWTKDDFAVSSEAVADILTQSFISGMLPFMS